MSGGQPAQTQQTSKVELPAWVDQASQANYQFAKDVADRPFQQYQGTRVADPSSMTTQGYDLIKNNIGSLDPLFNKASGAYDTAQGYLSKAGDTYGSAIPVINQAGENFTKAGSTLDTASPLYGQAADIFRSTAGPLDINQFLNPYTNEVEQRSINNANTALTQQLAGISSNAQKAGAFGGSRFGIQQGVAQAEGARSIGDLTAALRKAGLDFATSTALQDRSGRQAAGAGLLSTASGIGQQAAGYGNVGQGLLGQAAGLRDTAAGFGSTAAGFGNTGAGYLNTAAGRGAQNAQDVATLMSAGQQEQAQRQKGIDADMQKWQEQWQYPVEQLNMKLAALGMSPYGKTETGSKTATAEQPATDWATLGLGALKAIPGLVGMFSDRKAKTDIQKLTDGEIPLYAYRYKGDPKTYPKVVGPMAQDVEKKIPSAVKKFGRHRVIDINNLMEALS